MDYGLWPVNFDLLQIMGAILGYPLCGMDDTFPQTHTGIQFEARNRVPLEKPFSGDRPAGKTYARHTAHVAAAEPSPVVPLRPRLRAGWSRPLARLLAISAVILRCSATRLVCPDIAGRTASGKWGLDGGNAVKSYHTNCCRCGRRLYCRFRWRKIHQSWHSAECYRRHDRRRRGWADID
jgi:hypothetical protein